MLNNISCSYDDKLVCVVDASTYLSRIHTPTGGWQVKTYRCHPADNPVLMIYTLHYSTTA